MAGPARVDLPGLFADRAAIPEVRVGIDAFGAQGFCAGAASDGVHDTAAAAGRRPRLTRVAPWLAGSAGDLTQPCPTADAASHRLAWAAVLAPRAFRCARGDPPASGAAQTVLQVERVA